jgi:glutathione S-transferase
MIILHHLNNSRSQRILWMLEELELPYSLQTYTRDPATLFAPDRLAQVHPLGKAPLLEIDGLVLAESGAIVEYLVEHSGGRLGPPEDPSMALHYRMFLHYAEASVMPPLLVKLVLARVPLFGRLAMRRIQPMIDVHLDFIEAHLARHGWFAGESMTAADIMMSFALEAAAHRGGLNLSRPHSIAWLTKIHARPAYQRALAAGGHYAYAKEE